jgi:F420-dependent oxidoreductase-like protein
VNVGVHFMNFTIRDVPGSLRDAVADTAELAEEAGCTMFTFMDHYFQMEGFSRAEDPMLEGYTACGFVAGRTETMKLGLLVTGITYRYPGLLAKIVTTLDVLSGGRAMLGVGAAWYEREHHALGVPYPPIAERFERLEETIQICLQMWSDDDGPYEGTHYRLAETLSVPQPVQQPRPTIMIGGGGERKTLKLVARYADANNLFATSPEQVQHKLDVLKRHCDAEGRDPSEILNTTTWRLTPDFDADEFVAEMRKYAQIGIQHVQVSLLGSDPVAVARRLNEIVPRLAEL